MLEIGSVLEDTVDKATFRFFINNNFGQNKAFKNAVRTLDSTRARVLDIFELMTDHRIWDYLDYYAVEPIVNQFAKDNTNIKELIDTYLTELAGFKFGTKLSDYIKEKAHSIEIRERAYRDQSPLVRYDKSYYSRLESVLDVNVDTKCLAYVDEIWKSIATHCRLPSLPALLDMIQKGCLKVTWMVPIPSALQLQTSIQGSEEFFREQKIARIILDDEVLYDEGLDEVRNYRQGSLVAMHAHSL